MTAMTLSNAQQRVLQEAASAPESPIESFIKTMPAGAQGLMLKALERKGCVEARGNAHFITATGCNAVGHTATPSVEPKRESKQAVIINLLSREGGATLAELIAATEWKSHSVRGHLSNLRKKRGMNITSERLNSENRYFLSQPDALK
jgi:hypothetical protein